MEGKNPSSTITNRLGRATGQLVNKINCQRSTISGPPFLGFLAFTVGVMTGGLTIYSLISPKVKRLAARVDELEQVNYLLTEKADSVAAVERRMSEELQARIEIRRKQVEGKAVELNRLRIAEIAERKGKMVSTPAHVRALADNPFLMDQFLKDPPYDAIKQQCLVEAEAHFPLAESSLYRLLMDPRLANTE